MASTTLCCQQCACTHILALPQQFPSGSSVHTQPQLDATESSHPSLHKDLKLWDLPESVKSSLPPGRRHWPALIAVPYKNCGAHVHTTALLGEEGIKTSGLFTACPCRGHQSSMEITGSCPENRYNTLFPDWCHFLGKKPLRFAFSVLSCNGRIC